MTAPLITPEPIAVTATVLNPVKPTAPATAVPTVAIAAPIAATPVAIAEPTVTTAATKNDDMCYLSELICIANLNDSL